MMEENIYFELTRIFNASRINVVLSSGQAVVFYRLAIMSKDGDWIIREDEAACASVLAALAARGARYRPSAPLHPRWLAGGWSSHLEFADPQGRRIRCDFCSRPPRAPRDSLVRAFGVDPTPESLAVIDIEALILLKQTQRSKDYAVIAELARLLPPERELRYSADPDRILALSPHHGEGIDRLPVRAARASGERRAVVLALAEEIDDLQLRDRQRVAVYAHAAASYLAAVRELSPDDLELPGGHDRLCRLAEQWLPPQPLDPSGGA